jgi:MFS superfamily sulfate permease-like transporter
MIPDILKDDTTFVKNHTLKTHIFCILLRIVLGLLIITDNLSKLIIQILSLLVVIMFTYKFFKLPNVWKVYMRTVLAYAIVLFLTTKYNSKYNSVAGSILIVDALMGLQSRHIFEKIGLVLDNKKI